MSLLAALALAAAALEPAQSAFRSGDYAGAEKLALQAANEPAAQSGSALYLAALARFRAGKPAEALEALDAAAKAPDPPPRGSWLYNRAACLYELGRFTESEEAYADAAGLDQSLAAVALINAGFAALDGGSIEHARGYAERVRALGDVASKDLLADLDAHLLAANTAAEQYKQGLTAWDAGKYAEARDRFLSAARADPNDGKSRVMSGAAALKLGDRSDALADLRAALGLRLEPADARAARDYLDAASPGLASLGAGWEGVLRAGAGIDSNALQSGFLEPSDLGNSSRLVSPSGLMTGDLSLAYRYRPSEQTFAEFAYGLSQLAYADPTAADRSLQQHGLSATLEWSPRDDLRLGLSGSALLALTGLSGFRGEQASVGTGAFATYDWSPATSTRFELGYSRKAGLNEFDYLSGNRADALLSQELRLGPLTLGGGVRFRIEDIGTATQYGPELACDPGVQPPPGGQLPPQPLCAKRFSDPYGYAGPTTWVEARLWLFQRLELDASAGYEYRHYLDDNRAVTNFVVDGQTGAQAAPDQTVRRNDQRGFGSLGLSLRVQKNTALSLRYDFVVNRSNIANGSDDPRRHGVLFDGNDRSFDKHVLSFGTVFWW